MENKIKQMNWEKISVYFSGLALLITVMIFLNQIQRDIATIKEESAVIRTVLIMKNIMPVELAKNGAD